MNPQVGQSLHDLSFSLSSTLCLCISSQDYFVPPSKEDRNIYTLAFLLLELHGPSMNYILGILELLG